MKKKAAILSLLLLFFALLFNSVYRISLEHNVNLKASYIQRQRIDAEVLFHGPCEPLFTINPAYLESKWNKKVYNLSLDHSDFADNYLHLYLYLKSNKVPEYLFLYVTPESFDLHYNTFHTYRFIPFMNDSLVEATVNDCDSNYAEWSNLPLLKYTYFGNRLNLLALQGFKHLVSGRDSAYFVNGYEDHKQNPLTFMDGEIPNDSLLWGNLPSANKYPLGVSFTWNENRARYFAKVLDLATSKGIKTILYESPSYLAVVETQPDRLDFLLKTRKIAHKYDVPYWIFDDTEISDLHQNFVSPQIMNSKASVQFMDILYERIKENHK
jgi:hypothetical protein